jgi:GMP synthase-like glutamine amidotransferase
MTAAAASDPVFAIAPPEFRALQWHGDSWELPAGAVRLAGSDAYQQQAFVYQRAYGVQFHLEVGARLATEWSAVPEYADSLRRLLGDHGLAHLVGEVQRHEHESLALARALFARWLEHVVGVRRTAGEVTAR